jgi:NAD(P)-dependent dehydrogenase (short-subunit alcohol dehydrogenase family)
MMLKDKVAVIYGAGGAIGSAVARAFAFEGANVFLTGRHLAPVDAVAKEVVSAGRSAEAAEVDVLDEQAVDRHLKSVIDKAAASISRSTRSGSPTRTSWVCLWSSWMSSGSPCRSRPTPGRTF